MKLLASAALALVLATSAAQAQSTNCPAGQFLKAFSYPSATTCGSPSSAIGQTKVANYTLLPTDTGNVFNNLSAPATVTLTLPPVLNNNGLTYCGHVATAQTLTLQPQAADSIVVGTIIGPANSPVSSNTPDSTICIASNNNHQWVALDAPTGTWTLNNTPISGVVPFTPSTIAPHVATLSALQSSRTANFPQGVWRDDYSAGLGAPPLWFIPQTGPCSAQIPAKINDGGSCVNTTSGDGNSYEAVFPATGADPAEFGAPINNTGNAATGINLAIAFIRAQQTSHRFSTSLNLGGSDRRYLITSTINMTCLNDRTGGADGCPVPVDPGPFVANANGAVIICTTTGTPCIDALGTQFGFIGGTGLTIFGACDATEPSYGIQHGRTVTNAAAGEWNIRNISMNGCFTKFAYYNEGSEENHSSGNRFLNNDANAGSYGCGWDAANHFNVTSAFVTNTVPQNSDQSLVDTHVTGGDCGAAGPSSLSNAVFISSTNGLILDNVFLRSNNDACLTVYDNSNGTATSNTKKLYARVHCETDKSHITNYVLFQSRLGSTAVADQNWTIEEFDTDATTNVFGSDANTASVDLSDERFRFVWYGTIGGPPKVFDTGSKYTITNPERDFFTVNITGWTPTVGSCTGLGTGGSPGCAILAGSTPSAGTIAFTAGTTSPAGFGNFVLTFPFNLGAHRAACWFNAGGASAGGFWTAPGAGAYNTVESDITPQFLWTNGGTPTAIQASGVLNLDYQCKGI